MRRRVLTWVGATLWVLLAPVSAYSQPSSAVQMPISNPVWLVRPPTTLPSSFRGEDYRPTVQLDCRVVGETLANCRAVEPTPESFLRAALDAASAARIASQDGSGQLTDGREIVVRIGFAIPVAIDPPPAPPSLRRLTDVVWLEQPDAEDFARLYPPRAWQEGVSGQVTLDCIVSGGGHLSCLITAEDPVGFDFGAATLRLSREWRVAPVTSSGEATAGGRIGRTIRWRTEPLQNPE